MNYLGKFDAAVIQCKLHCASNASTFGIGCGNVITIRSQALANDLCINLCAASLGMLEFFENKDSATLAENKAITVFVIGARSFFGSIVARGERFHGSKASHRQLVNRCFNATGHDDVGAIVTNHFKCISHSFSTGCTCTDGSVYASFCLKFEPHICSRTIRHQHRHSMWTDRTSALSF